MCRLLSVQFGEKLTIKNIPNTSPPPLLALSSYLHQVHPHPISDSLLGVRVPMSMVQELRKMPKSLGSVLESCSHLLSLLRFEDQLLTYGIYFKNALGQFTMVVGHIPIYVASLCSNLLQSYHHGSIVWRSSHWSTNQP